jgi:Concanavalin A-like lectin/glucanases superfamily
MSRSAITKARTAASARTAAAASSLLSGLVDYWRLEEASGNHIGVNGHVFAPGGSPPTTGAGKLGTAAQFARASSQQFILSANVGDFSPANTAFGVGCWFNTSTASTTQGLFCKWGGSNNNEEWRLILTSANQVEFRISNGSGAAVAVATTATFATSVWNLAFGWYDPVGAKLWVQLNSTVPVSAAVGITQLGASGRTVELGTVSSGNGINGLIDGPFYHSRNLTAGERALIWSNGNAIEYPFGRGQLTTTLLRAAA